MILRPRMIFFARCNQLISRLTQHRFTTGINQHERRNKTRMRPGFHSVAETLQLLSTKVSIGFVWPQQAVPTDGKTTQPRTRRSWGGCS